MDTGWDVWIDGYLAHLVAAGRPVTTRELRRYQLRYLARTIGNSPGAVDGEDMLGWLYARAGGWKHETLRSYSMALRSFYGWAAQTGRVDSDPAAGLPRIAPRRRLPRPVPERVWRSALARADERVALMLRLAAEAGLRRGEIAGLRRSDVGPGRDGPVLAVRGKGGKDRRVPITESLAAAVLHFAGNGEWVFPSAAGGHVSAPWVGRMCSLALGGSWTLHTLRHRFGTAAYSGSGDLRAVQELLGHSSPAITQLYVAVGESALRAAMMNAAG